ncbi:hexosaminidase D-like [Plodia interpunctella]|uniref:hexosaminidase D-like n=1 Tax=Plodia interpunctella TaxID=58824 RepID=UPI0023683D79|nr:hexosaminidase D-like [Plodia interpunctella]
MQFLVAIMFLDLLYSYCYQQTNGASRVLLDNVVVHIDLKNTPLKLSYLTQLLPTLRKLGATGLLMEYEDMFPYEGELVQIQNQNSYRRSELKNFLIICKYTNLEVIPLVQTFGHMEYVLKHREFRELREFDPYMDSICPSKPKSIDLIRKKLSQVILFHRSVAPLKHIHIGCDEVYYINLLLCKECSVRHLSNEEIFMAHVQTVTSIVKNMSQDTTVLIWDDMLRFTYSDFPVDQKAEPIVWNYKKKVEVLHDNLLKYHKTFPNIWIASAYKGADGEESILPDIKRRFLNHFSWLEVISNYTFEDDSNVFKFKGIVLTGWSRYASGRKPVDILPCSLPSLVLNLILVDRFQLDFFPTTDPSVFYSKYLHNRFLNTLRCGVIDVEVNNKYFDVIFDYDNLFLGHCNFTEWRLYTSLKNYMLFYNTVKKTKKINSRMCKEFLEIINGFTFTLFHIMSKYYAPNFVKEYVTDLISKIKDLLNGAC